MWDDARYVWFVLISCAIILICAVSMALAHDSWISKHALKNGAGEWCCGDYDCKSYSQVRSTDKGWIVNNDEGEPKANAPKGEEFVPYDEAMPVAPPDGTVAICHRPDGSRRCVFGLKPGT